MRLLARGWATHQNLNGTCGASLDVSHHLQAALFGCYEKRTILEAASKSVLFKLISQ